jgi:hypothetical protein
VRRRTSTRSPRPRPRRSVSCRTALVGGDRASPVDGTSTDHGAERGLPQHARVWRGYRSTGEPAVRLAGAVRASDGPERLDGAYGTTGDEHAPAVGAAVHAGRGWAVPVDPAAQRHMDQRRRQSIGSGDRPVRPLDVHRHGDAAEQHGWGLKSSGWRSGPSRRAPARTSTRFPTHQRHLQHPEAPCRPPSRPTTT